MTDIRDDQTGQDQSDSFIAGVSSPLGTGEEKSDSKILSFEGRAGLERSGLLTKKSDKEAGDKIITARGNEHGLVLRIDGRAEWQQVIKDVNLFLGGKRRFFEGGEISIEWIDAMPSREQCLELETLLRDEYGVEVPRRVRALNSNLHLKETVTVGKEKDFGGFELDSDFSSTGSTNYNFDNERFDAERDGSKSTSDWYNNYARNPSPSGDSDLTSNGLRSSDFDREYVSRVAKLLGDDMGQSEEANARIVYGTLRSGQKVETPFSLIVVGDVNPGADLIAGGDIIVLGSLRGTAHASAYDDDADERVIIALHMHPMQLRIGTIISRGGDEGGRGPEIAHIEERRIVVEGFSSRIFQKRRGRI